MSNARCLAAAALLAAVAVAACKNDLQKVRELDDAKNVPSLLIENMHTRTTELGVLKSRIMAPELRQYHFAEEKHTDFPRGIKFYRYRDSSLLESSLVADEGINYEEKELWEVTGNVVMVNQKGEKLETDKLFWNQKEKRIYTDAWVKITSADATINGTGLVSDEEFNEYEVLHINNSVIYVDDKK
jgi:LPS export ABC transporter protein LptC